MFYFYIFLRVGSVLHPFFPFAALFLFTFYILGWNPCFLSGDQKFKVYNFIFIYYYSFKFIWKNIRNQRYSSEIKKNKLGNRMEKKLSRRSRVEPLPPPRSAAATAVAPRAPLLLPLRCVCQRQEGEGTHPFPTVF